VAPRVRIGDSAVVGAGSVVIRDVPPGRVFAGNPARELAGSQHALD
jgi:acetyltransferase-like isoleucine patch superfamily enzyme